MSEQEDKQWYSIGQVGKMTELEPHVLRFWETEFRELAPNKSESGRRVYDDEDVALILRIKQLLYDKKFTIEGAKNALREKPVQQTEIQFESDDLKKVVNLIKDELRVIMKLLD